MLAGAHPQPRLDRILARCVDLVVYGLFGFLRGLGRPARDAPPEAFSDARVMIVAVVGVVIVLGAEVVPLLLKRPSIGKALFALRIESASGGSVAAWQACARPLPLAMVLVVFLVSLQTSIVVWWVTLGLATIGGLVGVIAIVADRPTPWDRLAKTRVVSVPAEW